METTTLPSAGEKSQLVQMRLQPKTMQRLESLAELTGGTENKTTLVSISIQLAEEIIKSIKKGSKVYIETPDGEKERLKIIGL